MKSIVEQISKEVVAAAEAVATGIVTNVFVSDKLLRVRGYKVSDDEREEVRMLPLRRLIGEGDALVVRNLAALKEGTGRECPLGAKVYDTCGRLHGVLRDLLFEQESGKVLSLVAGEGEIAPDRVLSFGKKILLLRAPAHERVAFRKASENRGTSERKPIRKRERPLLPLAADPQKEEGEKTERESADTTFLFRDYAFLLGRKIRKNILNGELLIAAENDLVTPEVIFRAHQNGKLVELTVNSRK